MRKLLVVVISLVIIASLLLACSPAPAPSPTPSPTSSPSPTASPSPSPKPSPSPSPTPKPTTPAISFAGKTITIIQGSAPGGGTDIQARYISKWLPKYIPGKPTVIVQAMPGAGTMIAMNHVSSVAKPDGLTILGVSASSNIANLLGRSALKVPLQKMPLLMGVGTSQIQSMYTGLVDKFEDLYTKEVLVYGHMPPGGGTTGDFLLAMELLGIKVKKLMLAYTGTGDARAAYLSGEINSSGGSTTGYYAVDWEREKAGEIVPMWAVTGLDENGKMQRLPPPFEKVPTLQERYVERYGKLPSGIVWEGYKLHLGALCAFEKSYYLHPNTPVEIVTVLRDAFHKMATDPEFLTFARDIMQVDISSGEKMMKIFNSVLIDVDPAALKWYRDFFFNKYGVK